MGETKRGRRGVRRPVRSGAARFALLALISLGLSGCYRATFIHPDTVRGQEHDEWNSFFLFGLVGHKKFNATGYCRETQISSVRTGGNFGTGIVSVLTIGIYTPRKVYVTCATGERPRTEARQEEAR